MMKVLIVLAVAIVLLVACKGKSGVNDIISGGPGIGIDTATINKVEREASRLKVKTDTISFSKQEGVFQVSLFADYPVEGGHHVVFAVRDFINQFFGGAYVGQLSYGREVVNQNGEQLFSEFKETCSNVDLDEVNELFLYKRVNMSYESPTFVTFMASLSEYSGGIHGMGTVTGHTFSKFTGKPFSYDMMKNLDTSAFKLLIKEGLRTFFSKEGDEQGISDEDLLNELVSYSGSIDDLPLPDSEPYMTEQGIIFIYQPYEISYFAAGMPQFTIPYDVAKPYLTDQAVEDFLVAH